jgi:uncharacterized membrane protein
MTKNQAAIVKNFAIPLVVSSALSVTLSVVRVIESQNLRYWFLIWNLFLAWLPLAFIYWLHNSLKKRSWLHWSSLLLTFLWLGFLPNSFYLVTDFIHLKQTFEVSLLFDAVLFMTYAWNGLILGFISVIIFHLQLLKRFRAQICNLILGGIFLLCSFAIYLGRYLAWNTWDILINPVGILSDLGNRIVAPASHRGTYSTTILFFACLCVMYYVIYKLMRALLAVTTKEKN